MSDMKACSPHIEPLRPITLVTVSRMTPAGEVLAEHVAIASWPLTIRAVVVFIQPL
jgi:hypothetical protein